MKRLFDLLGASIGLVLLSPVFVIIALAILIDSPGPVLLRQERVGREFRKFTMVKFRTMRQGARGPAITSAGDTRVTRVGSFLRGSKLDELPQLFNVIRGDMSLVGPRPELPVYVELFRPDYEAVLRARPGITDLASIEYRNESTLLAASTDPHRLYVDEILPNKIALAQEYIERSSLLLDIRIILKTIFGI